MLRSRTQRASKQGFVIGLNERAERKRMESLLISNQIRNYCDQVDSFAGAGFGKLFLAGSLHKEPSK